jgi:hypothetical protein
MSGLPWYPALLLLAWTMMKMHGYIKTLFIYIFNYIFKN